MRDKDKKSAMQSIEEVKENVKSALDNAEVAKEAAKNIANIIDKFKL